MNALSHIVRARSAPRRTSPWQEQPELAYPILLILAVALVLPSNFGGPLLHDSFAIDWVWADQFTAELARGNLYPRWLPLSDGELGTPVFYFYPPLAFYLAAAFGLIGFSTYASVIAAFAAAFAGSGIACWHWLRGRSNHPLLAAAFFMAAPYHLFDYTVRGALAESVATALIPVIAIGLRRVSERRGGVVLTAVAYGAIICTHLPLALLVSIFFIAPSALIHRERLKEFAFAVGSGITLSAIYLVPAFALDAYRDGGQLYRTANLTTPYWSIYAGNWSDPTFTLVFALVAALVAAAAFPALKRADGWARYAIAVSLLVTGFIPLLWSLPLLVKVQFPYRALPIAEFALAAALARLPRRPGLAAAPALLPLGLSLLILPGFHIQGDSIPRLQREHPDVYEYLPRGVMKPGQTSARLRDVLGERIPPPQVPGMIVEPHFYFASWSCGTAERRTQLLIHEPSCTPRIVWTWAEKLGAAISAAAALIIIAFAVIQRRREPREQGAALS